MLHYLDQGAGPATLVILHGLFGTLDNWQTLARRWAEEAGLRVVSVDLRNHGRSFHAPEHSYELMAQDVLALFDHLALPPESLSLLGHSMGGKVAMRLALDAPGRLARLLVLDIAPRASDMLHQAPIIAGLQAVDLTEVQTRGDADAALARHIRQPTVRQFLLKNLYRDADNRFAWRINLPVLAAEVAAIGAETSGPPFLKPALFIRGGLSDYVSPDDKLTGIPALFPNSEVVTIPNAGHWVHAEKPDEVFGLVRNFVLGRQES
ncbi:alpha/beta fold hydrolase [uncultured Hymenobacter sp.]|uniref:alpha/beta fold hydrolase n=1 Tax=uncultured Hymenobacter sp. TaxID=170016 RepID=UPI0035CB06F8